MREKRRCGSASRSTGTSTAPTSSSGPARMTAAPAATACGTNAAPCTLVPASAANRPPGTTARLSAVTDVMSIRRSAASVVRMSGASSESFIDAVLIVCDRYAGTLPPICDRNEDGHQPDATLTRSSRPIRRAVPPHGRLPRSIGRQQRQINVVEPRLDVEHRRDAADDVGRRRRRVHAGRRRQARTLRVRLVEGDQH